MSRVVLFGSGRGARVAFHCLKRDSDHEVCGFTVDRAYFKNTQHLGLPVVAFDDLERTFPPAEYRLLIVIGYQGMNHLRAQKYLEARKRGYSFVSYMSSDIVRQDNVAIGENCLILDNQSINQDVQIGNNVMIWSSNHIGDCSVIRDHVWISSHATLAGNVEIGEYSFVGISATIGNRVKVAPGTFVGAQALITSDTQEDGVYLISETRCVSSDSRAFLKVMEATGKL